jgi:tRNA pseudouridine65 synthase
MSHDENSANGPESAAGEVIGAPKKGHMKLRVLYEDDYLIAVDKPAGFQVHTPTRLSREGRVLKNRNVMRILREQTGKYIFPVHRLDRATSGVLLFAFESSIAGKLQQQFKDKTVEKHYLALVRGWLQGEQSIESELDGKLAVTQASSLFCFELPIPSHKHPTSRYTLMHLLPATGRNHQIRRHFKGLSHPLIGDTVYGDGKHNRVWREKIVGSSLFLKAHRLHFNHPVTGERIQLSSRWGKWWHSLFEACGYCPL